ncbi:NAD-dependent epimerase/dehydratase family protein [uncultured Traorella sp.]|uniref:NAD-dependent epimerase/dehydratase family protein n=1 Tax=uncultured Traorella sp. TaxID=1929048 RepID=UPI0025E7E726|nr:NAD-dependent epimerase/dehydratase family protein [uncultured Traorella sp.]
MKRILITGKGSYIGTHFRDELLKYPEKYEVEELEMRNDEWRNHDFSSYDVVYHVAGLAHSTPDESQRELYYQVNTDLAYETAKKAKEEGVKQFIFMSSIIVYGSGKIGEDRVITKDTPLTPDNFYGDSKKQAEIKIRPLEDESFKVVIVRPPMIYGPNSKGNYPLMSKFARKTPIFPTLRNQRSMLYLGNLIEFIRLMIDNEESGIYLPQNREYVSSVEMIKEIAKIHNHKIWFTGIFNPFIKLFNKQIYINKVFGNLTIDKKLSEYKEDYNKYSFKESIRLTEGIS